MKRCSSEKHSNHSHRLTLGHYPKSPTKPKVYSVMKYLLRLRKLNSNKQPISSSKNTLPYLQRCPVRLTYSKNRGQELWRAHGRYLVREGGLKAADKALGFCASGEIPIAKTLASWEDAGDKHLFKLILSPEFGEQLDLKQLTCDFMSKLCSDLDKNLEWVAIDHYNTEHPHVHIALRGHDALGNYFRIPREYIKTTLRQRAQEVATIQLGVRTLAQVREAHERQVHQKRFTDLDRLLLQNSRQEGQDLCVNLNNEMKQLNKRYRTALLINRLEVLKEMGLASLSASGKWTLANEFETTLRQYQMQNDRLKMMYRKVEQSPQFSDLTMNINQSMQTMTHTKKKEHELSQSIKSDLIHTNL